MSFDMTGLTTRKYKLNRKLTDEERANQLHQAKRLDIKPFYNLSTIRANSTYLECIDRWFRGRGLISAVMLVLMLIPFGIFFAAFLTGMLRNHDVIANLIFWGIIGGSGFLIPLWALRYESFRLTHFPIRLNYKNRMVYAFKPNKKIIQAKWEDIFFTLGKCQAIGAGYQNWEIRGHILDTDRETVMETFAFPGDSIVIDTLMHYWEYFRRYMEKGPAAIHHDVLWCHDIADKRERFWAGVNVLFLEADGLPILQAMMFPITIFMAVGRWFSMISSRIPLWPAEIEAECRINPADPYRRDASNNPARIPGSKASGQAFY